MRIYTVHAPAARGAEEDEYLDKFEFVREGFRWLAFLFPPLWLLVNRVWWPFVGVLAVSAGLTALMERGGALESLWPVLLAFNLLIGFEADALKRWSLHRKGWRMVGVAAGRDEAEAQRSFFGRFAEGAAVLRGEVTRPREMVGLFPETGR